MRLNFLALDRPDLQYASKESAGGMAGPKKRHMAMLKRAGRYLIHAPGLVWRYARQRWPHKIVVKSDTDWAGCPVTRRSTSGTSVHFGMHLWLTSSTTQVPVGLSSGESETYGLAKSCSRAIGVKNLANDLGFDRHGPLELDIEADSSAAIGVANRRGSGKIRHLEAGCLWIQAALHSKRIERLIKIPGKVNSSDLMTKGVSREDLVAHLKRMHLYVTQVRSRALPEATAVERAKDSAVTTGTG